MPALNGVAILLFAQVSQRNIRRWLDVILPWNSAQTIQLHCDNFKTAKTVPYVCLAPAHLSRLMTKPTKWHVRPAKTQIGLGIRPVSLIRVFAVRMMKAWTLSYPLGAQRRLWSHWADAQTDLSLRWANMQFSWFCHDAALFRICTQNKRFLELYGSCILAGSPGPVLALRRLGHLKVLCEPGCPRMRFLVLKPDSGV